MAANDVRQRTTWGTRLRFLVRVLGLTGLVAAAVGAGLTTTVFPSAAEWTVGNLEAAFHGQHGEFARNAVAVLGIGAAAAALALVVELIGLLFLAAGRRAASGTTATVGIVAAAALLVCVNVYSFSHYARHDCTADKKFTLPPVLADDLRKLRPDAPTTIVVLQKHKTFGEQDRDSFTAAAELKVAEKVQDLVEQFREFGPRFRVVILDTEAFGYDRQLAEVTKDAPELKVAIDAAPENSIFFAANKRVQRLGFDEFLQLDKTSSRAAGGGRGNLVLLPQGVERFARRVLAVQERRPKVAVCVVHEFLTTEKSEGTEEYTLAGLKKTLEDQGFDVVDIVLKKNWNDRDKELEPAAYTRAENRVERLRAELAEAEAKVTASREEGDDLAALKKAMEQVARAEFRDKVRFYQALSEAARNNSWLEIVEVYRRPRWARGISAQTEPDFRADMAAAIEAQGRAVREETKELEADRKAADARLRDTVQDERAVQDLRAGEVKPKFTRLLADVDLVIVPRLTVVNATLGSGIPPSLHAMSKEQAEVVRDFIKSGRPVLALMGPLSTRTGIDPRGADDFERLLAERGVELGKQTILYGAESKAFAALKAGSVLGGSAEIPPLAVEDRPPDVKLPTTEAVAESPVTTAAPPPNPVGQAYRLTGRALAQKMELRLRAPRPVYLAPGWEGRVPFAAEFVLTPRDTWNEEKPFPSGDVAGRLTYLPRLDRTREGDAKKGTHEEERHGPFPVGVAIESKLPVEWFEPEAQRRQDAEKVAAALAVSPTEGLIAAANEAAAEDTAYPRPTGRLVVFGSGGIFSGPDLKPAQQTLLLHSVNWLVGRTDRLPTEPEKPWSYPRVEMSDRALFLWRWGAWLGLPLLVAYLGILAMMIRRLR